MSCTYGCFAQIAICKACPRNYETSDDWQTRKDTHNMSVNCLPAEANPTSSWKHSSRVGTRKVVISNNAVLVESAIQMAIFGGDSYIRQSHKYCRTNIGNGRTTKKWIHTDISQSHDHHQKNNNKENSKYRKMVKRTKIEFSWKHKFLIIANLHLWRLTILKIYHEKKKNRKPNISPPSSATCLTCHQNVCTTA